jgi:hypothetical protein
MGWRVAGLRWASLLFLFFSEFFSSSFCHRIPGKRKDGGKKGFCKHFSKIGLIQNNFESLQVL